MEKHLEQAITITLKWATGENFQQFGAVVHFYLWGALIFP